MNMSKTTLRSLVCATMLLLLGAPALAGDDGGNSKITPVVTVTPNILAAGKSSNAFVCISNGNPNSNKRIQSGDSFTLTFDRSIGALSSVDSAVLVNSSTLVPTDFSVELAGQPNQLVIKYVGASKVFASGEGFCLKVTIAASNLIGSGMVTCEEAAVQSDGRSEERRVGKECRARG